MSIFPELRTPRLLLRQFTMDDVDDVLAYTKDPEWAKYQVDIPPVPCSREAATELVSMFADSPKWEEKGILRMFAIVYEGRVIGELCLNYHDEDRRNDRFEIAYSLALPYWGRGLATEAARAAMDWAFQTHNFQRMYAWSDPRNTGSVRVMEKLGMKREGILRSHMKWDGTFRDRVYYGILRSEWEAGLTNKQ